MKVVLLAGGLGTRLSEYTDKIPKPMVEVGIKPILHHIMDIYSRQGYYEFIIATGYKGTIIKDYFLSLIHSNSDLEINLAEGSVKKINDDTPPWKISIVDTGQDTLTGGRLRRLRPYIGDDNFFLTYGDGLSNVDLKKLLKCHQEGKYKATVTAVRPQARFGEISVDEGRVTAFKEKPQLMTGLINGGFFVFSNKIFDYLDNDETVLEGIPLESMAKEGELGAYFHDGFWQCMDTKRDYDYLNKLATTVDSLPWTRI